MKAFIAASLILTGCGAPVKGGYLKHVNDVGVIILYGHEPKAPVVSKTTVEPDLQTIYDDFIVDGNEQHAKLLGGLQDVKWADSLDTAPTPAEGTYTIGLCTKMNYADGSSVSHVQILRQTYWDEVQLRTVVYHELGHCLLGLNHTPDQSHQIMDPVVSLTDDEMVNNWDELVKFEFASESK